MDTLRRTGRNLADVVGGELLLRLANVAVVVLIGRVYGAAVLGLYAAVLAVATVAERIADNGLEYTGIAEVSRNSEDLSVVATALYLDKTLLSAAAIALFAAAGLVLHWPQNYWIVAGILTLRTFLYSYCRLNAGLLKALNRTKYIAGLQSAHFVLLTSLVLLAYVLGWGMTPLVSCLLVAQVVEFVGGCAVLQRMGLRAHFVSAQYCWQMLQRSTAIGMTYTLSTLMLRGDVVVLSLIASAPEVGAFAAASTGLVALYVAAWLFSGVLLSDLGRLSSNRDLFESHFRKCLCVILGCSIPLAAVASICAKPAISLVFGRKFASATLPGALMMLALPFIFLNATFLSRTVARGAARLSLGIYGGVGLLSLALNYVGARRYGAAGVAGSIVVREAVITALFVVLAGLSQKWMNLHSTSVPQPEFSRLPARQEGSSLTL